jgi:hypothetical protein
VRHNLAAAQRFRYGNHFRTGPRKLVFFVAVALAVVRGGQRQDGAERSMLSEIFSATCHGLRKFEMEYCVEGLTLA